MGKKNNPRLERPGSGKAAARIREKWGGPEGQEAWRVVSPELLIEVSNLLVFLGRPGVAESVLRSFDEEAREDYGPPPVSGTRQGTFPGLVWPTCRRTTGCSACRKGEAGTLAALDRAAPSRNWRRTPGGGRASGSGVRGRAGRRGHGSTIVPQSCRIGEPGRPAMKMRTGPSSDSPEMSRLFAINVAIFCDFTLSDAGIGAGR